MAETSSSNEQPLSTPGEIEEASIEPIIDSSIPSDVTQDIRAVTPPPPSQSQSTAQDTPIAEQPADVIDSITSDDLFTVKFQDPSTPVVQSDPVPLNVPETAEHPLDDNLQLSASKASANSMTGSTDSYVMLSEGTPSPPQTLTESQLLPPEQEPVSKPDPPPEEWLDVLGNGSLKKMIVQKGGGNQPSRGQRALLNLLGRVSAMDGAVVEEQRDLEVEIGEAEVVQGLDLALPLMTEGEIAWVYMKSRFGYGDTGNGDNIPANVDLYYMVELKEVYPRHDYAAFTEEKLRELVERKKSRGNSLYKLSQLTYAITAYSSALKVLQLHKFSHTSEGKFIGCRILTNLAIVQFKQESPQESIASCDNALKLVPGDTKALFRKSVVLTARHEYDEAISCLEEALLSSPDDSVVEQELRKVRALNEQSNRRQREVYRRMVRGTNQGQQVQQREREENEGGKGKLVMLLASSVVAVAAICMGVFLYKRS